MSEIFAGAIKRFKRAAESKVNVRVTVSFEPSAHKKAVVWGRAHRYSYERDGELGGLLLAALASGAFDATDYDVDFEEEMDVDVEDEE